MQRRISVFGVIAGFLVVAACAALLLGATKTAHSPLPADIKLPSEESLSSYVYTLMAVGGVILLSSFLARPGLRAVLFMASAIAAILFADRILSLYEVKDLAEVGIPVSLQGLANFDGWTTVLNMPHTLEAFFGSMFASALSGGGVAALAIFFGAIHCCARAKCCDAARIGAGVTALIIFLMLVISTLYLILTHPNWLQNFQGFGATPARDQFFAVYALVFCCAGLGALIFPIYPVFLRAGAKRAAQVSFFVLVVLGISLPLVVIATIIWTSQIPAMAETAVSRYWQAASAFTAIEFALLLLPLVLLANGVSLILRHFAPEEGQGLRPEVCPPQAGSEA